ncbi:MAG: D-tyrosyl-tRNA(Tyr) deacylase [Sphingobacteriales bacterium]|jgi:D-tyrosyl-tRNA(Tyr) deacylase|nr:D-tyrosyl-tRNA(Tyr) deacylase [Sphingobacteriales bacterium]MBP9140969.1 D-tyrosyl-tRNA(Tyr) deacylase [Chitinophagales bacterium]MDA0198595.1 D-aminoacyl-tRNA deacylase [Bacteroidota bacterium]MBK6890235.1 D-tyrosyl-tRNA(Tyr) deacylase [Sphingobacteriales bacterium]MBK7527239.1 D-tyrosyl-tRNA(Tyr) deacylase [Sphingobacteriales bacterium]
MRAVIQRVSSASVTIDGSLYAQINSGFLILLGIEQADANSYPFLNLNTVQQQPILPDIIWLTQKIVNLRIFSDDDGKMNRSIIDELPNADVLVVSQFTLHASTKKGNRPSFIRAAQPNIANAIYEQFCQALSELLGKKVQTGSFGANMQVASVNDGPVTIIIDTLNKE